VKKQIESAKPAVTAERDVLDQILAEPGESNGTRDVARVLPAATAVVGRIAAIRPAIGPLVDFPANTSGALVPARCVVALSEKEVGSEVALVFEDGDPGKPIIIGVMQSLGPQNTGQPAEVKLDEETLILSARKEVVIRCGKASITLTSAGKLLIQGEYVVSRSSGVNKIRGGSVQIN